MLVPLMGLLEEVLDPRRAEGKLYKLPHVSGWNLPTGLSVGMSASRPCTLKTGQTASAKPCRPDRGGRGAHLGHSIERPDVGHELMKRSSPA
jgi:hypothetical protein